MKKFLFVLVAMLLVAAMLVGCAAPAAPEKEDPKADAEVSVPSEEEVVQDAVTDALAINDGYERVEGSNIVVHKASGREIDLDNLKVVCINKCRGYYWFDCCEEEGLKWAESQGNGTTFTYYAPADFDAASQMSSLMDALATDPDVLIIAPTAGEAVNEALADAKAKGTLTIGIECDESMTNIDYLLDPFYSEPMIQWYVDEYVKMYGDDFTYCLMVGKLTTPFQVLWCNTFYDYATEKYPNLKCMTERGAWLEHDDSEDTAAELTRQIALGNPEVSLIWSSSAGGTEGICRAINELGVADKVRCGGHVCPSGAKTAIDNGSMVLGSIHFPGAWGWTAAELGRKVIAGESLEEGLGYEEYENLLVDGKWVYGEAWYPITADTVDGLVEKWPLL